MAILKSERYKETKIKKTVIWFGLGCIKIDKKKRIVYNNNGLKRDKK